MLVAGAGQELQQETGQINLPPVAGAGAEAEEVRQEVQVEQEAQQPRQTQQLLIASL
jgi:hypothetical protein